MVGYRRQSNAINLKAAGSVALAGFLSLVLYMFSEASQSRNNALAGTAVVLDGDTIDLAGQRIRLQGIDAPELSQHCPFPKQKGSWAAGWQAKRHLVRLISDKSVSCLIHGMDRYGRLIGNCHNHDGIHLNAAMVQSGMAWAYRAYSGLYISEEYAAKQHRLGIWRTTCQTPWAYRQQRWTS